MKYFKGMEICKGVDEDKENPGVNKICAFLSMVMSEA